MKRFLLLLISTCFFVACAVSNRITVMENKEDGLKRIKLVQSPKIKPVGTKSSLPVVSDKSVSTVYQYEEKTDARPEITLEIPLVPGLLDKELDLEVFINLDNEDIGLYARQYQDSSSPIDTALSTDQKLNRKYVIPENLWVSIVHSREILYRIKSGDEAIHIVLNESERDKLIKFLKMSIEHRDAQFPAIPEGQVKW